MISVEPFQPVKSAGRALDILEALAEGSPRRSLGELARDLGIPKSSLHSILKTMVQRRWVETDESGLRFGLGVRSLLVGASYVDTDDVVVRAQPVLDWLSHEMGEAVHLGRLDGPDVVYLAKRESSHPLRLFSAIGRRLPAHATALGKALLACRTADEVHATLPSPLPALNDRTIVDGDELDRHLAGIRERGYAVDNEENTKGIRCFAVALRLEDPPQDALSFSIPLPRLDPAREARVIELLLHAQERLEGPTRRRLHY